MTDRFTPTKTSIRWEMEVVSDAAQPWTTPLELRLKAATKSSTRFWTAWVNGVLWDAPNTSIKQGDLAPMIPDGNDWGDPLVPLPWMNRTWDYGNGKGTICIPIATVLEPESDNGLSLRLVARAASPLGSAFQQSGRHNSLPSQPAPARWRQASEVHRRYCRA